MTIGDLKDFQLIVALDPATLSPASKGGSDQALHPDDFVWFVNGGPSRMFRNDGKGEARFIGFAFQPD